MASNLSLLLLVLGYLTVAQAQIRLYNLRASNLASNNMGSMDAYVKVFCGSAYLGKTVVRNNNVSPWWTEEFTYFKAKQNDVLKLEVYDRHAPYDELLGVCQRQLRLGTHGYDCTLKRGGTLIYIYTLSTSHQ
ncbi:perforin-1-like [Dunckerocampus dactyliophorus]|uniref:perforin-1-like n=1 Tax=Dunckerocampus dactyliophorus TaxID=161453 RepID=UPI00240754DA|nr:perforin-1-like [Dunckerocampus dactyliophorus]